MAEALAREDVRQVHLDRRRRHRGQGVPERDTRRVRVGRRVQDDAVDAVRRLLNPVDELAFVVRLPRVDLGPEARRELPQRLVDGRQVGRPVDVRLARPEQVQVRAVQDQDAQAPVHRSPAYESSVRRPAARGAEHEAGLAVVAVGPERHRDEVVFVQHADDGGETLGADADLLGVARLEELRRLPDVLEDDGILHPHGLDLHGRVGGFPDVGIDRDPIEPHEQAGHATFGAVHDLFEHFLEHSASTAVSDSPRSAARVKFLWTAGRLPGWRGRVRSRGQRGRVRSRGRVFHRRQAALPRRPCERPARSAPRRPPRARRR